MSWQTFHKYSPSTKETKLVRRQGWYRDFQFRTCAWRGRKIDCVGFPKFKNGIKERAKYPNILQICGILDL